jgi:hypothetical protein
MPPTPVKKMSLGEWGKKWKQSRHTSVAGIIPSTYRPNDRLILIEVGYQMDRTNGRG